MKNCSVRDFGAVGNGVTKDTAAIQAAIDDCGKADGGRVTLENGTYLCGRIDLRSGVELHIEADAVLLGSVDGYDFPDIESDFWRTEYAPRFNKRAMIYAENCKGIAITGHGRINCQGDTYMEHIPGTEAFMDTGETGNPQVQDYAIHWPYRRKAHPTDSPDGMVHYDYVPFPLDPFAVSLSPGRVVMFIGCTDVFVEDVTLENAPAGWSYWMCDCENVHFREARVLASVLFPNNDGIHINCCRNVTISDCNITCGDDGIVVRAYSMPLKKHTVCEKVTVTNCNITSHSGGIPIGWYGDGVIRNCTFSNLTMTDTCVGIDIRLPRIPVVNRGSDQGDEDSLYENLSFCNITMDRVFLEPIYIGIGDNSPCAAIRNLYFDQIHAFAAHMPSFTGRADTPIENIYITNSQFTQIDRLTIPDEKNGPQETREESLVPHFEHVKNLCLNGVVFNSLND